MLWQKITVTAGDIQSSSVFARFVGVFITIMDIETLAAYVGVKHNINE